jgi:hypothetical protein
VLAKPEDKPAEPERKKQPDEATEDGKPAENGHEHWPAARPDIVRANDRKPRDEKQNARQKDERGLARDLLCDVLKLCRHEPQQQRSGDDKQRRADQTGDRFRGRDGGPPVPILTLCMSGRRR